MNPPPPIDPDRVRRIADAARRDEQADKERARQALAEAVAPHAARAGFQHPEAVHRLLPAGIDPGDPQAIAAAVAELVRSRPGLRTAGVGGGTPAREAPPRSRFSPPAPGEPIPTPEQQAEESRARRIGISVGELRGRYSM